MLGCIHRNLRKFERYSLQPLARGAGTHAPHYNNEFSRQALGIARQHVRKAAIN